MKQPRINPNFNRAADLLSAWRKIQKQALNEQERASYGRLENGHSTLLREHSQNFHEREGDLLRKEITRVMLEKPDLALRLLPMKQMRYSRARSIAQHTIFAKHEQERQGIEKKQLAERDAFLHRAEQERAARMKQQPAPQKAPEKIQQKMNDAARPSPLAASLKARVAQKAAEQKRDMGRGRS